MGTFFEYIANGKLGTLAGGQVMAEDYDHNLIVSYSSGGKVYIATKFLDVDVGGGNLRYPKSESFLTEGPTWESTIIFNHENPEGTDPTGVVYSPPAMWVCKSGNTHPVTGQPSCRSNIIHLAWVVKYTSGANINCYQILHTMRDHTGTWLGTTLSAINQVTPVTTATGVLDRAQLIGLRRWNGTAFENHQGGQTTLYVAWWGKNSDVDIPNVYIKKLGGNGNDWDATQTWDVSPTNMTLSLNLADNVRDQFFLTRAQRTSAIGGYLPGSSDYHYVAVAYNRKNYTYSPTVWDISYSKYFPHTGSVLSDLDPFYINGVPNSRNHAIFIKREGGYSDKYLVSECLIFIDKGYDVGYGYYYNHGVFWAVCLNGLMWWDTNQDSHNSDNTGGQGGGHDLDGNFTIGAGDSNQGPFTKLLLDYSDAYANEVYYAAEPLTMSATGIPSLRTVDSVSLFSNAGYTFTYSIRYPSYNGTWYKDSQNVRTLIEDRGHAGRFVLCGGGRSQPLGGTIGTFWANNDISTPGLSPLNAVRSGAMRSPWFQDGTAPRTYKKRAAFICETYLTDGTDNRIWMIMPGGQNYQSVCAPGEFATNQLKAGTDFSRATYNVDFDLEFYNNDHLLVGKWDPTDPYIFFGMGQLAAIHPYYIKFSVKNSTTSNIATAILSCSSVRTGTISFSLGSELETDVEARLKTYTSTVTANVTGTREEYLWMRWVPPPPPVASGDINVWLKVEQLT